MVLHVLILYLTLIKPCLQKQKKEIFPISSFSNKQTARPAIVQNLRAAHSVLASFHEPANRAARVVPVRSRSAVDEVRAGTFRAAACVEAEVRGSTSTLKLVVVRSCFVFISFFIFIS